MYCGIMTTCAGSIMVDNINPIRNRRGVNRRRAKAKPVNVELKIVPTTTTAEMISEFHINCPKFMLNIYL